MENKKGLTKEEKLQIIRKELKNVTPLDLIHKIQKYESDYYHTSDAEKRKEALKKIATTKKLLSYKVEIINQQYEAKKQKALKTKRA